MDYPARLSDYPWILVRVSCIYCNRQGSYRLARLAARYGADIPLDQLRRLIAADCPYIDRQQRKYVATCGCHFPDLDSVPPQPPDLPPFTSKPRIVASNPHIPKREPAEPFADEDIAEPEEKWNRDRGEQ